MRAHLPVLCVLLAIGCSDEAPEVTADASSVAGGPFHGITFSQARERAAEQGKVVFIDFFTTWCPPCKKLDETTWNNESVVSLLA